MKLTSILFATLLSSGALANNLVDDTTLNKWGFVNVERQYYNLLLCETPQEATIVTQTIRAKLPEANNHSVFPRFTLVEEKYANADLASARIQELTNWKFEDSLQSKSCYLRKARQIRSSVFLVHTDALRFSDQLDMMLSQLTEYANTMAPSSETAAAYFRLLCDPQMQNLYAEIMRPQPPNMPASHLAFLDQQLVALKQRKYFRHNLLLMLEKHGVDGLTPSDEIKKITCKDSTIDPGYIENTLKIISAYLSINDQELEANILKLEQQLEDTIPELPTKPEVEPEKK